MTTPYTPTSFIQMAHSTPATPSPVPAPTRGRGTGAKRGRKPRGAFPNVSTDTRPPPQSGPSTSTPAARFTPAQWATPGIPAGATASTSTVTVPAAQSTAANAGDVSMDSGDDEPVATQPLPITAAAASTDTIIPQPGTAAKPAGAPDEDVEGEDELLPAMADDDYSAQLSWQSESKDNLKYIVALCLIVHPSYEIDPGCLWTTSVRHSMNALKPIDAMHYRSRLYGRCELVIMIIRCAALLATPRIGYTTNDRTASVSTRCANSSRCWESVCWRDCRKRYVFWFAHPVLRVLIYLVFSSSGSSTAQ